MKVNSQHDIWLVYWKFHKFNLRVTKWLDPFFKVSQKIEELCSAMRKDGKYGNVGESEKDWQPRRYSFRPVQNITPSSH